MEADKKSPIPNDVVVVISGAGSVPDSGNSPSGSGAENPNLSPSAAPTSSSTLTSRKSLTRSTLSKPKSRLMEPSYPSDAELKELIAKFGDPGTASRDPQGASDVSSTMPRGNPDKTTVQAMPATVTAEADDDDEEVYKTASLKVHEILSKNKKLNVIMLFEWAAFILITGFLIATLTVHRLVNLEVWGLRLWRWCVLLLVIFCGRLVTEWLINLLVLLIERSFLLKKKVLYFVHGLKGSVQFFCWLCLSLLAWGLLINHVVKRSEKTENVLNYITRALVSFLVGSGIWLVKTVLIKLLASSFQCTRFFDRIQESFYHQFLARALSGPPLMENEETIGRLRSSSQLKYQSKGTADKEGVIDVGKLQRIKQEAVSAWTMKGLVDAISGSGLSTLDGEEGDENNAENEITSEWGAKAAAYQIFQNVAKPGSKYIEEVDLLCFLKKDDVDNLFSMFEGVETRQIKRSSLKNWLVKVYLERKSLTLSLNDTKTAIEELNRLASAIVLIVLTIVWLLLMGLLTTQVLLFITSQLLLVGFLFNNTAKTVFEAIIFVFVMHPFDVGDRCVVDGVQMIVEEMNILSTIFLRYDNKKIYYPNSVLSTKPISNFYRSPEMSDSVEFAVDFSTSIQTIAALKDRIKTYLESKPQYWRPGHGVLVKEIEDVNKMRMGLYMTHTINFQKSGDRGSRRSELVLELKKIFEDLGIKYSILPQDVRVSYVGSAAAPSGTM